MMEEIDSLKIQLKTANIKVYSYCTDIIMLRGTNKCLDNDLEAKGKLINELQAKINDSREAETKVIADKDISQGEVKTLKNALNASDTSHTNIEMELKSLRPEYDLLVSQPSVIDAIFKNKELLQHIKKISKENTTLKGEVSEFESFRKKSVRLHDEYLTNISEYNELTQFGSIVFPEFDAGMVISGFKTIWCVLKRWEEERKWRAKTTMILKPSSKMNTSLSKTKTI